jgi:hypothetical protein
MQRWPSAGTSPRPFEIAMAFGGSIRRRKSRSALQTNGSGSIALAKLAPQRSRRPRGRSLRRPKRAVHARRAQIRSAPCNEAVVRMKTPIWTAIPPRTHDSVSPITRLLLTSDSAGPLTGRPPFYDLLAHRREAARSPLCIVKVCCNDATQNLRRRVLGRSHGQAEPPGSPGPSACHKPFGSLQGADLSDPCRLGHPSPAYVSSRGSRLSEVWWPAPRAPRHHRSHWARAVRRPTLERCRTSSRHSQH